MRIIMPSKIIIQGTYKECRDYLDYLAKKYSVNPTKKRKEMQ